MNVELMLLTVLQGLRTQILDAEMLFFTHLGDAGFIWAALTAVLLVFRRTRRVGCVLAAASMLFFATSFSSRWWPASAPVIFWRTYSSSSLARTISPFLRAIRLRPSPR